MDHFVTHYCCMCEREPVPAQFDLCSDCRDFIENAPEPSYDDEPTLTAEDLALREAYAFCEGL